MVIRRIAPRRYTAAEVVAELVSTPLMASAPQQLRTLVEDPSGPEDVASGRGPTYEWEIWVAEILERLALVESYTVASYTHHQATPSASWVITHNLGARPLVQVTDSDGELVEPDIDFPDTDTAVIGFSVPVAGDAYFRV